MFWTKSGPRAAGVAFVLKRLASSARTAQPHHQNFGLSVGLKHIFGLGPRVTWLSSNVLSHLIDCWRAGGGARGSAGSSFVWTVEAQAAGSRPLLRSDTGSVAARKVSHTKRCANAWQDGLRFEHWLLSAWPRSRARPPGRRARHTRRRHSHPRPRLCPLPSPPF